MNSKLITLSLLTFALVFSGDAFASKTKNRKPASNSNWSLCRTLKKIDSHDSFAPIVSTHEHKSAGNSDGTSWEISLVAIYGVHVLTGKIDTTESNSGNIELKGQGGEIFKGKVEFLDGRMTLNGEYDGQKFNEPFRCETLN